jgi:hypothetical protein
MNITQAKQIPLRILVEYLGGRFSRHGRAGELWFYSPFRPNERTASFKIDEKRNQWHDFARTEKVDAHGDVLDLWTDYHNKPRRNSAAIKEALKALEQFSTSPRPPRDYKPYSRETRSPRTTSSPRYQLVKNPGRIWKIMLKQELARRGLELEDVQAPLTASDDQKHRLGAGLLKQAQILDTKTDKTFSGFAFQNDKGGYDISIPNPITDKSFKSSIGKKWITIVPGTGRTAHIFEGFWDFYTWVKMNDGKTGHTFIILNSASNIKMAADYIVANKHIIRSVATFLDNDTAGENATLRLSEMLGTEGLAVRTMNHIYKKYKDLNDYWMDQQNV